MTTENRASIKFVATNGTFDKKTSGLRVIRCLMGFDSEFIIIGFECGVGSRYFVLKVIVHDLH